MTMNIEHTVAQALTSLEHLEKACHTVLDLEIGLSLGSFVCPIEAPEITLREAIDYCRDTLRSQLIHFEQGEAAENLADIFAEVAHNLDAITLREAIKHLHASIEKLVIVEQTLVRLKIEAQLTTAPADSCSLQVQSKPNLRAN